MEWEIVVGLELHAQLLTKTKIFSGAQNLYGSPSNTQACLVDLGMPGVLPVLNQDAIRMAIMFGLATNATIADFSVFARKNYFYPDLPKGYQISQLEFPIVSHGHIHIEVNKGETKRINITRAHLEEDAGKLLHEGFFDSSAVDFNRAGTPLLEIVSEPDLRSAAEAVKYMKKIHSIVRYLDICDGNMEEGSFRCDVNISIRPTGQKQLGTRTEIKNLNSFRFVEQAINFEADRQTNIIESGGEIIQETRLYDANKGETRSMRSKEEANDYRYFPDPDLLPVKIEQKTIDFIQRSLPELADNKKKRFIIEYGLSEYDAALLTSSRKVSEYFELVAKKCANPKLASNWVNSVLTSYLKNENKELSDSPVSAPMLSQMLCRIIDGTITGKIAKTVFASMWNGEGSADEIIEKQELKQITDNTAIDKMINEIISNNQEQVKQFQSGKEKLMGFFIGQIMKLSKGKANPPKVEKILREKLCKKKEQ